MKGREGQLASFRISADNGVVGRVASEEGPRTQTAAADKHDRTSATASLFAVTRLTFAYAKIGLLLPLPSTEQTLAAAAAQDPANRVRSGSKSSRLALTTDYDGRKGRNKAERRRNTARSN